MEDIIGKNIAMLSGSQEGCMRYMASRTTFGGGGPFHGGWTEDGRHRGAVCFYFDPITGEMKYFGNYPRIPDEIKTGIPTGKVSEGRLVLAYGDSGLEILGTDYTQDALQGNATPVISAEAREVLRRSVALFNERTPTQE